MKSDIKDLLKTSPAIHFIEVLAAVNHFHFFRYSYKPATRQLLHTDTQEVRAVCQDKKV